MFSHLSSIKIGWRPHLRLGSLPSGKILQLRIHDLPDGGANPRGVGTNLLSGNFLPQTAWKRKKSNWCVCVGGVVPSAPPRDPPLSIIFNVPEFYAKALTAVWQMYRVLTWILINDDEALILTFWLLYHFSTANIPCRINRIGCWLSLNTRLGSQQCQFTEIQNYTWRRNN